MGRRVKQQKQHDSAWWRGYAFAVSVLAIVCALIIGNHGEDDPPALRQCDPVALQRKALRVRVEGRDRRVSGPCAFELTVNAAHIPIRAAAA